MFRCETRGRCVPATRHRAVSPTYRPEPQRYAHLGLGRRTWARWHVRCCESCGTPNGVALRPPRLAPHRVGAGKKNAHPKTRRYRRVLLAILHAGTTRRRRWRRRGDRPGSKSVDPGQAQSRRRRTDEAATQPALSSARAPGAARDGRVSARAVREGFVSSPRGLRSGPLGRELALFLFALRRSAIR